MAIEYRTTPSFDPAEVEYFFRKRGWEVTYLKSDDINLTEATNGAALECADGRSDNFPGKHMYGPRVFGGINAVAAMLYGGDFDALHEAAKAVNRLGFAPGTHSAEHGGCGYVDLWMADELRSAVFAYQLKKEELTRGYPKLGEGLKSLMKTWGGKHIRLNGMHIEEGVRLNPYIGLTVGRIVDRAVDAVEEMDTPFAMHTDHHVDLDDLDAIGCGHIAKAENPHTAKDYEVDPEDVKKALTYLRIKLEGRNYYHLVNLDGEHQEQGVLIITGTKYTVNHSDPKSKEMFFVFDKARDEEYQRELFDHLHMSKITYTEFKRYSDLQLDATLKNLAHGLPIFEVNADADVPEVKFIGKVV